MLHFMVMMFTICHMMSRLGNNRYCDRATYIFSKTVLITSKQEPY